MKRILAVLAMVVSISLANAQQRGQGQGPRNPEDQAKARTERLVKQLNLSEEQKTSVHGLFLEQAQKRQELFSNSKDGDRQQARQQMRAISQETNAKVVSILNDEQKAKYEQMQAERQNRASKGQRPNRGKGGQRPDRNPDTNQ